MALTEKESDELLTDARKYIGKTYNDIDCSNFVHDAYYDAGMEYPYRNVATFDQLVGMGYFTKLDKSSRLINGDVLLFKKHMGIWDPDGCTVLTTNQECKRMNNNMPVLSSRQGDNRGPDYGQISFFPGLTAIYRWKGKNTPDFQK